MLTCTIVSAQLNMQFRSQIVYGTANELSNICGYVDSVGNEYALVGCQTGVSIVNVTNPSAPFQVYMVPGTNSYWREIKVWGKYAYVTTEGCCNGLQIVNLSKLPAALTASDYKYWKGSGVIANQINKLHSLHIDNGYAYLNGVNGGGLFGGACMIVSLADPWNPIYTGNTQLSFSGNARYVHDCYVRNDTLWGAHIYGGFFSVISVANKSAPVLIGSGTQMTPGAFTHNVWLSDAGQRSLFATDEVSNSYMTSYDVSNTANITELDRVQLNPGSGSIVHNTHIRNNYAIVSWYKEGVAIVDVSRPDNMIITGYYDTYPQGTGSGFNGCWGVYPFLPSGTIVASDINNGLFVLTPTYIRGCYLEGTIRNRCNQNPIPNVTVQILSSNIVKQGRLNGIYKTGTAAAGTYDILFSKAGYKDVIITNVSLSNGNLTVLDVQMDPLNAIVVDSVEVTHLQCHGDQSGGIHISTLAGTQPFAWLWSDGSTTPDLTGADAGTYTVTITDGAGCSASATSVITQPDSLVLAFSFTDPSCASASDGSITAYADGGTLPYAWQWNLGPAAAARAQSQVSDSSMIDQLASGIYICTLTDAHGCTVSAQQQVNAVNPCSITLHLKIFTEGLYQPGMNMVPATGQPQFADTFTVMLADVQSPHYILFSDTALADTSGSGVFVFPGACWLQSYYIVVRHRNSIETWSRVPVSLDAADVTFDFRQLNPLYIQFPGRQKTTF
jgi:choice-of-anchor B domain-containing protein